MGGSYRVNIRGRSDVSKTIGVWLPWGSSHWCSSVRQVSFNGLYYMRIRSSVLPLQHMIECGVKYDITQLETVHLLCCNAHYQAYTQQSDAPDTATHWLQACPYVLKTLCGGMGTCWIYQWTSIGPIINVPLPDNCPLTRFIFVFTVFEATAHPPVPQAVTMIDTLSPPSSPPNCVLPPETAYITLARYADRQYQGTVHHMQSSTFEAKKELLRKSKVRNRLS